MSDRRPTRRGPFFGLVLLLAINGGLATARAVSAAAVGVEVKTGRLICAAWHHRGLSEKEARERAMRLCLKQGVKTARIIASTPVDGCGAIVAYIDVERRNQYMAILGKSNYVDAESLGVREAELRGARNARVLRHWCD